MKSCVMCHRHTEKWDVPIARCVLVRKDSITEMKCVDTWTHHRERPRLHCIRIIYSEET